MASDPVGSPASRVPAKVRAFRTLPSSLAFSPVGRFVAPERLGIGRSGHVALTFDDGPDPVGTPQVMRVLDALGWRATFFVLADQIAAAPGLVGELVAAGHEVGVHAGTHRSHRDMNSRAIWYDVERAHDSVVAAGADPRWYRPPHGALSRIGARTARRLGMQPVLWTAWGRDWRAAATPQSICADLSSGRLDGGTILLHDSDCVAAPGSWHATVGALALLAGMLESRGLTVGPLGEHFGRVRVSDATTRRRRLNATG